MPLFKARPAMLVMLIGAAATSAAMSAAGIASPPHEAASAEPHAPATRLGTAITDDIAQRDSKAAREARALDLREQAVKAAQARLAASLTAQQQAAGSPAAGQPGAAATPDQFDTLARIYAAMKPAKAAPVFAQLDLEVQYLVAKKMRERSAAMLLAAMEPDAAARLSMALAGKKPVLRKVKAGAVPPK